MIARAAPGRTGKRIALAAGLVALAAAVLIAAAHGGANVASVIGETRAVAALHPALAAAGFAVAYVLVAASAVPIVGAMTIAAGAMFGPWLGVPLVVASGAAGATLAMLVVRHALAARIAARFPDLEGWLDAGGSADGAALLFAARVSPVVPFALVNAAAGLSRMPARTFALVSAAGALPLAAIYVSAGAALGAAAHPADLLTPRVVLALALAGAAPLLGRLALRRMGRLRFLTRRLH